MARNAKNLTTRETSPNEAATRTLVSSSRAAHEASEQLSSDEISIADSFVPAARRAPEWIVPAVQFLMICADAALVILCFCAAFWWREGKPILDSRLSWSAQFAPYAAVLQFAVPVRLLCFAYYRLYKLRGEFSYVEEGLRIFKAAATGSLLVVAVAFLYRGGFAFRDFSYSRGVFLLDFALAFAAFLALRLFIRFAQTRARRRDLNLIPTLVVGRGAEAALCIREMRERPELGYRVVGVVENGAVDERTPKIYEGAPIVGGIENLAEIIRKTFANEVIIAEPRVNSEQFFEAMMRVGRKRSVEFRIVPSLFNTLPRKIEIDQIGALPMLSLFREPLSQSARLVKRASDVLLSTFALVILSPLLLLIALLIKLDSRGKIFYKQERVGMDGRIFLFYKFRTMHENADDRAHREVYLRHIRGATANANGETETAARGKVPNDPRVTRVGRFLRRTSLDELPQLWNVLRGDMSVVGPRPPIPYEVEAYDLWHRKRLDMKPGLTGLWQVSGRNRLAFEEMVRLDLFYIENWSLWLDLQIILKTIPVIVRGDTD